GGDDKGSPVEQSPHSFDLAIPVRFTGDSPASAEATLGYDEQSGQILLKRGPGTEAVPLVFLDIRYTDSTEGDHEDRRGAYLLVNTDKALFGLVVPRSPIELVAPEDRPSALYLWQWQQDRKRRGLEPAEPPKETEPADRQPEEFPSDDPH